MDLTYLLSNTELRYLPIYPKSSSASVMCEAVQIISGRAAFARVYVAQCMLSASSCDKK